MTSKKKQKYQSQAQIRKEQRDEQTELQRFMKLKGLTFKQLATALAKKK